MNDQFAARLGRICIITMLKQRSHPYTLLYLKLYIVLVRPEDAI
jgi:hypothetical protein